MILSSLDIELGPERSVHLAWAGEGRDIVLLHGALATHEDWLAGPFGALSGAGRAIAVDRPGHGLSRRPRFEAGPRQQAAQVREALLRFDVERPILVGHSFGGLVALAYAELFPDEVSQLVLLAPIAFPELRPLEHGWMAPRALPILGPLMARSGAPFDRVALEMVHQLMFSPAAPPERWKRSYPWELVLSTGGIVSNGEDSAAIHPLAPESMLNFGRIEAPAHILQGTADLIVDANRQAYPLSKRLPHARYTALPTVGHMLHHTASEAVVSAVRESLAAAP